MKIKLPLTPEQAKQLHDISRTLRRMYRKANSKASRKKTR
jgi:hypothetical protein